MDGYVEGDPKSENACTDTKIIRTILDVNYEKLDLNKVIKYQYQHLTEYQRKDLLKLLKNLKDLFNGTLGSWKTSPVDFELK